MPFSGVFGTKGSIGTGCAALLPDIKPPTKPVPAKSGSYAPSPRRLATKIVGVWNEIAPGPKQERVERKKVLALAHVRTGRLDPRHRTDPLVPLGYVRRAVLNVLKIPFRVFSSNSSGA